MGYLNSMAHFYDLSTPVGLPDLGVVGGNPGVGANIASNPIGIHGKSICAEFNGNDSNYNLGDVVELNAVTAFTIAFWMRIDVISSTDYLFQKGAVDELAIVTFNNEIFFVMQAAAVRGYYNHAATMNANQWYHIAWVYNGLGVGNVGRLQVYQGGLPMPLAYTGTIPATSIDHAGISAFIGRTTATSFGGLLDSFAIFTDPLTQLQVADFRKMTMQGRL